MTFVARIDLPEESARRLVDAVSDDPQLGWPSVAASEIGAERWSVEVYFAKRPTARDKAALDRLARHANAFSNAKLPEADWVAKSLKELKPVRAGRFLIHGRHDRAT